MKDQPTRTRLFDWMVLHSKSAFLLMCFSFVSFGVLSYNLVVYVAANANYLLTYQWEAIVDGGAQQLVEIWATALLAMACYLMFKLCEHALIERIAHQPHQAIETAEIVKGDDDKPLP